jgi:hypothetical protein
MLEVCGRSHSLPDVRDAIAAVSAAGMPSWSLDLISGLPGLTPQAWQASLDEAVAAGPHHISIYDLQVRGPPGWWSVVRLAPVAAPARARTCVVASDCVYRHAVGVCVAGFAAEAAPAAATHQPHTHTHTHTHTARWSPARPLRAGTLAPDPRCRRSPRRWPCLRRRPPASRQRALSTTR